MPPLEVYTARLGYRGPLRWLDVSLQGNVRRADAGQVGGQDGIGLWFAPTPALLYPFLSKRKFGRLTADDWTRYVAGYVDLLRGRYRDPVTRAAFDQLLARDHVVLLCFCTGAERCGGIVCAVDGCAHCHRRVLADVLVKLGAVDHGELEVSVKAREIPEPGKMLLHPAGDDAMTAVMNVGTFEAPELMPARLCRTGRSRKRCSSCQWIGATIQCDYPLSGARAGATCDLWLCFACATTIAPDVHYCPPHVKLARRDAPPPPEPVAPEEDPDG